MIEKLEKELENKYGNLGLSKKTIKATAAVLAVGASDENLSQVVDGAKGLLTAIQGEADKVRGEKSALQKELDELKAKSGAAPKEEPQPNDVEAMLKKMLDEKMKPLQDELSTFKASEAASKRNSFITNKAKELGIPKWRQEEGFSIASDADDTTIENYLNGIKKNIVAAGLEKPSRYSIDPNKEPSKEEISKLADKLKL